MTTAVWSLMNTVIVVVKYFARFRSVLAITALTFYSGTSSSFSADFLEATMSGVIGRAVCTWMGFI